MMRLLQFVGETFLWLKTVVLAAWHGEGDPNAGLHVDELAELGEAIGVDEQSVLLDVDVRVQDGECLVETAQRELGR